MVPPLARVNRLNVLNYLLPSASQSPFPKSQTFPNPYFPVPERRRCWVERRGAALCHDPLPPSLDVLIQHQSDIRKDEAADVKPEEVGRVAGAEFQADLRGGGMLEPRIFDLTGDLICVHPSLISYPRLMV